eukprot:1669520-Alexandrium_andersonii.AAC.1
MRDAPGRFCETARVTNLRLNRAIASARPSSLAARPSASLRTGGEPEHCEQEQQASADNGGVIWQ